METPNAAIINMDMELALRICAEVHRRQGQPDIAEMYLDGANREAARKLIKEVNQNENGTLDS